MGPPLQTTKLDNKEIEDYSENPFSLEEEKEPDVIDDNNIDNQPILDNDPEESEELLPEEIDENEEEIAETEIEDEIPPTKAKQKNDEPDEIY